MHLRPVLIGNFGPPTLACIRSWGEKGCKVGLICIAPEGSTKPKSKFLDSVIFLSPEKRFSSEGIKLIVEFLNKFNATGLAAISEEISKWIYEQREHFPEKVALWVNKPENLVRLLSKENQIAIAKSLGMDVLPTYFLDKTNSSIEQIKPNDYPLCLRPSLPFTVTPPFKVKYIENKKNLINFLESLDVINEPIVAQPFLMLPNLNIHISRSSHGDYYGPQSFLVERKFKGVSLTFRPFQLDDSFFKKCFTLAEKLDAVGPFDIEFLFDRKNNKIYFIELNNRFGGATAKAFACGYDEPYYGLKAYGVDLGEPKKIKNVRVISRHAAIKCIMATIQNQLTPFDYPVEGKIQRIIKLLIFTLFYYDDIFYFKDIKGSLSLYLTNIMNIRHK